MHSWDWKSTATYGVFVSKERKWRGWESLRERKSFLCLEQRNMTKERNWYMGPTKIFFPLKFVKKVGGDTFLVQKDNITLVFFIMYSPMLFFLIYTPLFFWKWQTCLVQLMYRYSYSSKYLILYLILLNKHIFLCVDMHVNYYLYIRVLMSFTKYTSFFPFTFSLIPNNLKIILPSFHFLFIFIP